MADFSNLFDPSASDEPVDLDELLSASELLERPKHRRLPARSKTSADLSAEFRASSAEMAKFAVGTVRVRTRIRSSHSEGDFNSLPPEPQQGNVEYKLKLVNPTRQRLEHLVTQMKWRLREGQGEAIYEIGVEDNGLMTGLSDDDIVSSVETLREMAGRLGATIQVLRDRVVVAEAGPLTVAEILVRKVPDDRPCIEVRVCVLGSADVGKSTLVGVLAHGRLDDGRGRARLNIFRHLHEVQTGRTSSVSHELLGFDAGGRPVDYSTCSTAEEICETSAKLVTFVDLAGHQRYLRTTLTGLTGYSPHYVMLVISASAGVGSMTAEHLGYAVALEVPLFVVLTKVDETRCERVERTLSALRSLLGNKVALVVRSDDDLMAAASNARRGNVVPILCVSAVSGSGLDLLRRFLHVLPPGASNRERERLEQAEPEFQVDEIFDVPGVGCVVGGLVARGIITEGAALCLGPLNDGSFRPVAVTSIKRNRAPCRVVRAAQSAALAIDVPAADVRRGMVLLDPRAERPRPTMCFKATVNLLFHPTEIQSGFRTTVHVGNVRQTAVIESIQPASHMSMRNDRATVLFRFIRYPEFIRPGSRLLFREGRTKGIGCVTEIEPYEPNHSR